MLDANRIKNTALKEAILHNSFRPYKVSKFVEYDVQEDRIVFTIPNCLVGWGKVSDVTYTVLDIDVNESESPLSYYKDRYDEEVKKIEERTEQEVPPQITVALNNIIAEKLSALQDCKVTVTTQVKNATYCAVVYFSQERYLIKRGTEVVVSLYSTKEKSLAYIRDKITELRDEYRAIVDGR